MSTESFDVEETRQTIIEFLESVGIAAGADGVVIGLSGGIDSTTVAYLAVDAFGVENVHGMVLPGEPSRESSMSDAERVATTLGIEYDVLPIDGLVSEFAEVLPRAAGDKVALGNTRARVRAVLEYFLANAENRVVLGTGNRTEALVGYYTKYGDGAVDCLPIGNLHKSEVRELARHMGVAEDLVTKTPSAELWEGQTDEDELDVDYDTIEEVLHALVETDLSPMATYEQLNDIPLETVEEINELYRSSEHKRAMPPMPEK